MVSQQLSAIQPDFKAQGTALMGLELEFHALDRESLVPLGLPSSRLRSQDLLQRMAHDLAASELQQDGQTGEIIGLNLPWGNFSLEPGGQLEIATLPHPELQGVLSDLLQSFQLLEQASQGQVLFLSHGTNPLAPPEHPLLVPKYRYRILDRYFRSQPQGRGVDMMRHSATCQPNVDVLGAAAWSDAVRLSLALTPAVRQLFSNSRYFQGQPRDPAKSERQAIWQAIDPSRTGIPDLGSSQGQPDLAAAYARWAEEAFVFYIAGLPLEEQPLYGQLRYQDWARSGYQGRYPSEHDWINHLGTLFPELRLRRFLELRMIDAPDFADVLAPLAFWTVALSDAVRPQLWQLLQRGQAQPRAILEVVAQAASDPLARTSLQQLNFEPPQSLSALDFVRQRATLHPSQALQTY